MSPDVTKESLDLDTEFSCKFTGHVTFSFYSFLTIYLSPTHSLFTVNANKDFYC